MALVKTVFETKLKLIFAAMLDGSKTDAWMAEQMATEIQAYILSGQASTTDGGAAPAGAYAGAGVGTMEIDADDLKSKLQTTFEAQYNNDDLAAHIAADIDDVCKADKTVSITSTGTVTIPAGGTSPFSGPGEGKFSGDKTLIEITLKACYASMNNMSIGGDDYHAAQFATGLVSYLTSGTISINLKPPFVSGTGSGDLS